MASSCGSFAIAVAPPQNCDVLEKPHGLGKRVEKPAQWIQWIRSTEKNHYVAWYHLRCFQFDSNLSKTYRAIPWFLQTEPVAGS